MMYLHVLTAFFLLSMEGVLWSLAPSSEVSQRDFQQALRQEQIRKLPPLDGTVLKGGYGSVSYKDFEKLFSDQKKIQAQSLMEDLQKEGYLASGTTSEIQSKFCRMDDPSQFSFQGQLGVDPNKVFRILKEKSYQPGYVSYSTSAAGWDCLIHSLFGQKLGSGSVHLEDSEREKVYQSWRMLLKKYRKKLADDGGHLPFRYPSMLRDLLIGSWGKVPQGLKQKGLVFKEEFIYGFEQGGERLWGTLVKQDLILKEEESNLRGMWASDAQDKISALNGVSQEDKKKILEIYTNSQGGSKLMQHYMHIQSLPEEIPLFLELKRVLAEQGSPLFKIYKEFWNEYALSREELAILLPGWVPHEPFLESQYMPYKELIKSTQEEKRVELQNKVMKNMKGLYGQGALNEEHYFGYLRGIKSGLEYFFNKELGADKMWETIDQVREGTQAFTEFSDSAQDQIVRYMVAQAFGEDARGKQNPFRIFLSQTDTGYQIDKGLTEFSGNVKESKKYQTAQEIANSDEFFEIYMNHILSHPSYTLDNESEMPYLNLLLKRPLVFHYIWGEGDDQKLNDREIDQDFGLTEGIDFSQDQLPLKNLRLDHKGQVHVYHTGGNHYEAVSMPSKVMTVNVGGVSFSVRLFLKDFQMMRYLIQDLTGLDATSSFKVLYEGVEVTEKNFQKLVYHADGFLEGESLQVDLPRDLNPQVMEQLKQFA